MRVQAADHVLSAKVLANRLHAIQTYDPVLDRKVHAIAHDIEASLERHLPEVFPHGE
jgi:hypothetical protein